MTQTYTLMEGTEVKVPSVQEISPLPAQIEQLEAELEEKKASYRMIVEGIESAVERDLDEAQALVEQADAAERDFDEMSSKVVRLCNELSALVTEKAMEVRVLGKKLGLNGGKQSVNQADEILSEALLRQKEGRLTSALLKVHEAHALLNEAVWNEVKARMSHHHEKVMSMKDSGQDGPT